MLVNFRWIFILFFVEKEKIDKNNFVDLITSNKTAFADFFLLNEKLDKNPSKIH